ncbi:hypothetical protein QI052_02575 [Staphylococcus saprophyticus]|nr:hypothetical protein [Staphylococcus saprophyticus]
MVKIKQKKQLNLPQLIEWALENGIKNTYYVSENRHIVTFDENGFLENATLPLNAIFTVKVEEEITEDMKLDFLLDHFINPYGQHYVGDIHHNRSINDVLEENDEMEIATNSIHLFDKETKEFKLIWRDGKLVE